MVDLGGLEGIRSLHLDENLLSGSIPLELSNLPLLEDLGLEGNDLSGCVPNRAVGELDPSERAEALRTGGDGESMSGGGIVRRASDARMTI